MAVNKDDAVALQAQAFEAVGASELVVADEGDATTASEETSTDAVVEKMMPQMEVRVTGLSIAVEMDQSMSKTRKERLPTIASELSKAFTGLLTKKTTATKHILRNVNCVFKPGKMTLILGQPGSGKSTLMKILSGRFQVTKNMQLEGEVTYNGTPREKIIKKLPQLVSYVAQRDHHFPTLTVKETLGFAHECCGGCSTDVAGDGKLVADTSELGPSRDIIIQHLGLENCQDTIVGNAMLRGVSGGERKRVTTGEMMFGNKYVTLMDEISTGLDSAATYDIIKTQRSIAKKLRKTVVIALLQPTPEVFALFDEVMILNDGYVMYHGPREQIMDYFEGLGFKCPPRRDHADYLMDLGTKEQHQYEVACKDGSKHPREAWELASIFERSSIHEELLTDLHRAVDRSSVQAGERHLDSMPEFCQSFSASTQTLVLRQLKTTLRNTAFIKGRVVMVLIMGFLNGALFWQFDVTNVQIMMGLLFSSVLFLALGQASQLPMYVAAREVFYKQRGANFFRTSSYVLACSVSQLPINILETFVFGSIVYWACGFVAGLVPYVIFLVLVFLTNLAFAAWFFFVAAISPDLHIAKPMGMVSIMFFVLFAGFVITQGQIPAYYLWAYWLNPIAWCLRSIAINQYLDGRFMVDVFNGIDYQKRFQMQMGEYSLRVFDLATEKAWLWYGFVYLAATYVFFMWLSFLALEYKRYESSGHAVPASERSDSEDDYPTTTDSQYAFIETPRNPERDALTVDITSHVSSSACVPVTVAFKDLWYSVPNPATPNQDLVLLKGISGYAKPGTITALMGSTGAGKTTLMDVIAGRKTGGKIQGQILLNGSEATDLVIRRATGYCEQMDVHSDASTFREALTFSAFLRQGSDVPDSQKHASVEECLDILDLRPIADQIIRGSSVEQMKRLTIGVELAAQPSVLFLDEPTSGLDARSAKVIMDGVRKVANTGRTIVCTIHQPSWEVFQVFDSLLLLKMGGETVYFGELGQNASELITYFQSIEGVAPLDEGYNPATWMLEVIGAGVGNTAGQETDFVQIFKASAKKALMDSNLDQDGVARPAPGVPVLDFVSKRAASNTTQAKFLIRRFLDTYWRTPSYNLTRFFVYVLLALIFGTAFLSADYDTYQGINAGEGVICFTTAFLGIIAFNSVLPIASEERASFYRERAAQTYNAFWYFLGSTIAEIPYVVSGTLLYTAIFFPMVGFTGVARFFYYWLNTSLFVLSQAYSGQLLAFAMPSVEVAAIVGVLVNSIFFMFMGFNPPANSIPSGFQWLYHITPHKYALAILSAIVFGDCPTDTDANTTNSELACKLVKNLPPTQLHNVSVKQYVEDVFLAKHSEIPANIAITMVFFVFVRVLALLALRFINHQKK